MLLVEGQVRDAEPEHAAHYCLVRRAARLRATVGQNQHGDDRRRGQASNGSSDLGFNRRQPAHILRLAAVRPRVRRQRPGVLVARLLVMLQQVLHIDVLQPVHLLAQQLGVLVVLPRKAVGQSC